MPFNPNSIPLQPKEYEPNFRTGTRGKKFVRRKQLPESDDLPELEPYDIKAAVREIATQKKQLPELDNLPIDQWVVERQPEIPPPHDPGLVGPMDFNKVGKISTNRLPEERSLAKELLAPSKGELQAQAEGRLWNYRLQHSWLADPDYQNQVATNAKIENDLLQQQQTSRAKVQHMRQLYSNIQAIDKAWIDRRTTLPFASDEEYARAEQDWMDRRARAVADYEAISDGQEPPMPPTHQGDPKVLKSAEYTKINNRLAKNMQLMNIIKEVDENGNPKLGDDLLRIVGRPVFSELVGNKGALSEGERQRLQAEISDPKQKADMLKNMLRHHQNLVAIGNSALKLKSNESIKNSINTTINGAAASAKAVTRLSNAKTDNQRNEAFADLQRAVNTLSQGAVGLSNNAVTSGTNLPQDYQAAIEATKQMYESARDMLQTFFVPDREKIMRGLETTIRLDEQQRNAMLRAAGFRPQHYPDPLQTPGFDSSIRAMDQDSPYIDIPLLQRLYPGTTTQSIVPLPNKRRGATEDDLK